MTPKPGCSDGIGLAVPVHVSSIRLCLSLLAVSSIRLCLSLLAVIGNVDFSQLYFDLSGGDYASLAAAQEAGAATINYGLFLNNVLDFLIVAFAIFMVIMGMNKMKKKEEEKSAELAKPSDEVLLLTEIRDALKARG
jgi:large conductance mechanosensitive channel protein